MLRAARRNLRRFVQLQLSTGGYTLGREVAFSASELTLPKIGAWEGRTGPSTSVLRLVDSGAKRAARSNHQFAFGDKKMRAEIERSGRRRSVKTRRGDSERRQYVSANARLQKTRNGVQDRFEKLIWPQ